jgi:hypothetical protein
MADELKRALDTIMRPGFGALRPTAITPAEGASMTTPHQKAIEAAAKAYRDSKEWPQDRIPEIVAAYLASARESGWELKPREPTSAIKQAQFYRINNDGWREMFDSAPRFEDAS